MAQIVITNDGSTVRYVGSTCILPGETKILDARPIPKNNSSQTKPDPDKAKDKIDDLHACSVAEIVRMFPDLTDDELKRLKQLEDARDKPRSTLMSAISADEIRRAAEILDMENDANMHTKAEAEE